MVVLATETPTVSRGCFEHFWGLSGEWVEPANTRRGGESGVQRIHSDGGLLYSKRQTGHIYRSLLYPFGRPTVLREKQALAALTELNITVPRIVFCGAQRDPVHKWRALLITHALDGFEQIEHWYAAGGRERHGEAVHDCVLQALAEDLARMHKARWQHGCLYIKHVFVRVTGDGESTKAEVALLDLEKSRQRLTARSAASHDMKQLRRHSSFHDGDWEKLVYFYTAAFGSAIKGL